MAKKLLHLFLFFFTLTFFSQEKGTLISGKLIDSISVIKNANIINLKTKQGTFSFDDGTFSMHVSKGDTLQISSIQHVTRKIIINSKVISSRRLSIKLLPNTYVLEEFELKRNNLTGQLGVDLKTVQTDRRVGLLNRTMDFSNVNFKLKDTRIDANIKMKPIIVNTVANSFSGGGAGASIPFKDKESLLRKKLNRQQKVPYKILTELGEDFFFKTLKIPKAKYFHFLEYCNPLGIEDLHKNNKILDLIEIFQKQSVPYLKLIKKE